MTLADPFTSPRHAVEAARHSGSGTTSDDREPRTSGTSGNHNGIAGSGAKLSCSSSSRSLLKPVLGKPVLKKLNSDADMLSKPPLPGPSPSSFVGRLRGARGMRPGSTGSDGATDPATNHTSTTGRVGSAGSQRSRESLSRGSASSASSAGSDGGGDLNDSGSGSGRHRRRSGKSGKRRSRSRPSSRGSAGPAHGTGAGAGAGAGAAAAVAEGASARGDEESGSGGGSGSLAIRVQGLGGGGSGASSPSLSAAPTAMSALTPRTRQTVLDPSDPHVTIRKLLKTIEILQAERDHFQQIADNMTQGLGGTQGAGEQMELSWKELAKENQQLRTENANMFVLKEVGLAQHQLQPGVEQVTQRTYQPCDCVSCLF